jgi:hypothetical protein
MREPRTCRQDGSQLFVLAEITDWTGTCTVRLGERAALCAAGVASREEFIDGCASGVLMLRRVHLRLKRTIVQAQEGKLVSLVAVCATPSRMASPVPYIGPLLEAKVIPAKLGQLRLLPFGGLAVEVEGERLRVHAASVLLRIDAAAESTVHDGMAHLRFRDASDAAGPAGHAGDASGNVCVTITLPEILAEKLAWEPGKLFLGQVVTASFADGAVTEVCCSQLWPVSAGASCEGLTPEAFQEELGQVHACIKQARTAGRKRKIAAVAVGEYFTPEKRRVCGGLLSPPTSSTSAGSESVVAS